MYECVSVSAASVFFQVLTNDVLQIHILDAAKMVLDMKAKFNTLLQFLQSYHVTIAFAVFDILIRVRIATTQLMTKTFDCVCVCVCQSK